MGFTLRNFRGAPVKKEHPVRYVRLFLLIPRTFINNNFIAQLYGKLDPKYRILETRSDMFDS